MILPLLLSATLATADDPGRRVFGLGLSAELGSQAIHGVAWVPAADWRTVEARVFIGETTSIDFGVDWIRLILTRLVSSEPTLPSTVCVHLRSPTGGGWALALAPGLDTELGWSAVVVDEQLAHRPVFGLAPSAKLGFEKGSDGHHHDVGVFLRGSTGVTVSPYGIDRSSRITLQLTFTWNLLGAS